MPGGYYVTPYDYNSNVSLAPNPRGLYENVPVAETTNQLTLGWVRYSDTTDVPYAVQQRTLVPFTPTSMLNNLRGVYAGYNFFDGYSLIDPRSANDLLEFQLNLSVTPQETGGAIQGDIDVASSLGPITTDSKILFTPPNVSGRVTLRFLVTVLSNFLANGAQFYLTSTVPCTVTSETLLVSPR